MNRALVSLSLFPFVLLNLTLPAHTSPPANFALPTSLRFTFILFSLNSAPLRHVNELYLDSLLSLNTPLQPPPLPPLGPHPTICSPILVVSQHPFFRGSSHLLVSFLRSSTLISCCFHPSIAFYVPFRDPDRFWQTAFWPILTHSLKG